MPASRGATVGDLHAALTAWCERYLPKDTSGPKELGVRSEKRHLPVVSSPVRS
jgi:hypothetical protein